MLKPVLTLKPLPSHPEQGLTLIECLVAIVMVALVAGSIAPVMVISVASRVNNQKAEQALGLAQAEIDRTRTLVERGEATINEDPRTDLPEEDSDIDEGEIATTPGISPSDARPVDIDQDGTPDFLVHTFRTTGITPADADVPAAFNMGVRVYDIRALDTSGTLLTQPASLALTGGEGQRSQRPLAALYTTIADSDDQERSLCNLIEFLNRQQEPADRVDPPDICD
jgi:prepilin-type N-terminal cleavage/methylation domain-containing protein